MSKAKLRAEAIDRFVTDAKAQGVYSSLKAACIMTGWDTLAGALTPLVGSAPTNVGFLAADYDRGGQGLKGDGAAKFIDSNRANNADGQNDSHRSVYVAARSNSSSGTNQYPCYIGTSFAVGCSQIGRDPSGSDNFYVRANGDTLTSSSGASTVLGLLGTDRSSASQFSFRINGENRVYSVASQTPASTELGVFAAQGTGVAYTDARLSWYSIGSSVDLSALDTLVTRLMADLRAIEEDGMDRNALAYIRAVEAADGSFMVTGVKQAVDRLVKGLKYDKDSNGRSAWDAIGASCLLCGPRTIAGALVPLKGVAPTAQGGWTASDYNQETGLKGNGSTLYLDTNRAENADGQNDRHAAVYQTLATSDARFLLGTSPSGTRSNLVVVGPSVGNLDVTLSSSANKANPGLYANGLLGGSRDGTTSVTSRGNGTSVSSSEPSASPTSNNYHIFACQGSTASRFNGRLAFYSIGASLSLSSLDSRITKYVSDVAAAIP